MAVTVHKALAGYYWSDAGALMGVLPYAIWSTKIQFDERRRFQMALNLLVIKHHERIILVDTGLGNKITDRLRKIYNPSEFLLPTSLAELGIRDNDVTDVIMTHLHFDHAGGIVTGFADQDRLTFPKARYWIQAAEWQIAKHPEGLNRAAYNFKDQLSLLEAEGNIELLDGDREIYPGLNLRLVGGHTFGSQIVELDTGSAFYLYAGDIIPTQFHLMAPITSAYDTSRTETYNAKLCIFEKLKEKDGYLLLDHELEEWQIHISDIST